ncbi:MAG: NAD(P)/FAD-dependent oxidoreductase [Mesorhizobium sp.]
MDVETIVIGAGVVGLAVARRLAMLGQDVLILEQADAIGTHTSSRNSEVIHAGLYYTPGSLKAQLCLSGRDALYAYCKQRDVAAKKVGKLIVAVSPDEVTALETLLGRARTNGVEDVTLLDKAEARRIEPEVECFGALYSPSSGIVDSHALMLALLGDAEAYGASCVLRTRVTGVSCLDKGFEVRTSGLEDMALECRTVVNCAGLGAQALAHGIDGYPAGRIPPLFLAKGNYFSVSGKSPFSHLIYPLPVKGGLGVHVTLDLSGRIRLGPDLHWTDKVDYTPDASLMDDFYAAVAPFWPGVTERELSCTYSGIRPKLQGPGAKDADFMIEGPSDHGIDGLVNFFGIESPGLTSSLALADHAASKLGWS